MAESRMVDDVRRFRRAAVPEGGHKDRPAAIGPPPVAGAAAAAGEAEASGPAPAHASHRQKRHARTIHGHRKFRPQAASHDLCLQIKMGLSASEIRRSSFGTVLTRETQFGALCRIAFEPRLRTTRRRDVELGGAALGASGLYRINTACLATDLFFPAEDAVRE